MAFEIIASDSIFRKEPFLLDDGLAKYRQIVETNGKSHYVLETSGGVKKDLGMYTKTYRGQVVACFDKPLFKDGEDLYCIERLRIFPDGREERDKGFGTLSIVKGIRCPDGRLMSKTNETLF